ncbi:LacI family DNA-binding transcriptional regulator [Streptosporangium sp. V21-05]|uniref:LacI family DNA-binding transcriptional regulator n=1 Tax=Streptosporangium sp. V21-05 TaxID=3446115 RepID=UPI003F539476
MTAVEGPLAAGSTPSGALTRAELAELAGVSTATVSKVVNGHAKVGSETRALVERLIRERGYRSRRQRLKSTGLIEVVFRALAGDSR